MSSHHTRPPRADGAPHRCQNCDAPLSGPYCSQCGQQDIDFHRSFGHVFHEVVETWFHVDGKFLRGFHDILFRPGVVSREFNEGKRARHVPPFRFYLVISLLFFFVVTPHDLKINTMAIDEARKSPELALDLSSAREQAGRSSKMAPAEKLRRDRENRELSRAVNRLLENPQELVESLLHAVPRMLLVCMPVFALLTLLAYRKAGWTYLQHLVFSLHLHTFLFLWWIVALGWTELVGLFSPTAASWLTAAAIVYPFAYAFLAFRQLKRESIPRTLFKGAFIATAYGFFVFVAAVFTIVLTLVLLLKD